MIESAQDHTLVPTNSIKVVRKSVYCPTTPRSLCFLSPKDAKHIAFPLSLNHSCIRRSTASYRLLRADLYMYQHLVLPGHPLLYVVCNHFTYCSTGPTLLPAARDSRRALRAGIVTHSISGVYVSRCDLVILERRGWVGAAYSSRNLKRVLARITSQMSNAWAWEERIVFQTDLITLSIFYDDLSRYGMVVRGKRSAEKIGSDLRFLRNRLA